MGRKSSACRPSYLPRTATIQSQTTLPNGRMVKFIHRQVVVVNVELLSSKKIYIYGEKVNASLPSFMQCPYFSSLPQFVYCTCQGFSTHIYNNGHFFLAASPILLTSSTSFVIKVDNDEGESGDSSDNQILPTTKK